MTAEHFKRSLLYFMLAIISGIIHAQDKVPVGIFYQAVARDNFGNELVNRKIDVKFSIIAGDPLSIPVYQEVHQDIYTSKYGVFSLVIGQGVATGNYECSDLSEIAWQTASFYLKVEVKFDNDYLDMGTMQFLAVPYALYAQKSLEPGPAGPKGDIGPKGDPGDPASDNQTLSVVNVDGSDYLAISGGNQVKIANIEKDGDPANEIQDILISSDKLKITNNASATEWDLTRYLDNTDSQGLTWDPDNNLLGISGNSGTINLSGLKNDADADPANEIQDLQLSGDKLSVTGKTDATEIDLGVYRDNTDNQQLSYSDGTNTLTISGGNSVTLGSTVAFRAKKLLSETASSLSDVPFIPSTIEYNDGSGLNATTGEFVAPITGIYTFSINYYADGSGGARKLSIYYNSGLYEEVAVDIASGTLTARSITMKLNTNDTVSLVINTGISTQTGTGTFSGYKVY